MAERVFAERAPLAHAFAPGTHGTPGTGVGVTLEVRRDLAFFSILAKRVRLAELAQTMVGIGLSLPPLGQFVSRGSSRLLWSGPDHWSLVGPPSEVERVVVACEGHALTADQSDGRAIVAVSGPRARVVLAKGVPLDLHPRVFKPGMTAVTEVAGVAVQIWQTDEAPTYELSFPRSFAEHFWGWLTHSAAEYGYDAVES